MKRSCADLESTDEMVTDTLDVVNTPKRLKENQMLQSQAMELTRENFNDSGSYGTENDMLTNVFRQFATPGQHTLVERDFIPLGIPLVNPNYTSKRTYQDKMELDASFSNTSQFVAANMGNKVDQIGRQMKFLHESLHKALSDSVRDSQLHMAACNFVKNPGHVYHLYERSSGQNYFSMLSPEDWGGQAPHKFLGSWYLESDQSWTPAEDRHLRFEGIHFLKEMILKKSIQ